MELCIKVGIILNHQYEQIWTRPLYTTELKDKHIVSFVDNSDTGIILSVATNDILRRK